MHEIPISPLDPTSPVDVEWTLPVETVMERWRVAHGIDVRADFAGIERVRFCRCRHTRLGFTSPPAPGGPSFYGQLERNPWYYRAGKWEHRFAGHHFAAGARLLDVGCGAGDFLEAATAAGAVAEGIDFSGSAVAAATARGLRASTSALADVANRQAGAFDVVTALQVLEHIPAPRPFLEDCFRLLRPGGRLVIAVPDSDGWLRRSGSVLELPPHHATHWNPAALHALTSLFSAELLAMEVEPLDPVHGRDFAAAVLRPCAPDGTRASGLIRRLLARTVAHAVSAVAGRLPGITLAAVLVKR